MRDAVPVVDLEPFRTGSSAGREATVAAVRGACEEIGFLLVAGHGVPAAVVAAAYDTSRTFFDLPRDEKLRYAAADELVPGLPILRPLGGETLGVDLDAAALADLKESLDWGPTLPGVAWPDDPPGLRPAWEGYYAAMGALAETLVRTFALALDLPEEHFVPFFDADSSGLRVIDYPQPPPGAAVERRLRGGAHRDYGCLTILRIEDAPGGLQVQTRDGAWVDVPSLPDAFVVNLGDLMARWTGDRWVSTLHRVAMPPPNARLGSRRQSLVFFHNPRADALIEPVAGAAHYEPVHAGDYILGRASAAFTG